MLRRTRSAALGSIVALCCASLALGGTASAEDSADTRKNNASNKNDLIELQVLSFNDYHGHLEPPEGSSATLGPELDPTETEVGGAEYLATALKERRQGKKHTVTVAAGDLIGGSPFLSGLFHDEPSVETLNAMGLDVSSVGNHEFDEGLKELRRMQKGGCHPEDGCYTDTEYGGADFRWLAANVVREKTGKSVLPSTWVKKYGGVKVGFIGMTLEGTPELVAASGIRGLKFQDEIEAGNRAAAQLNKRGVKAIVVLLHEGGFSSSTYEGCEGISDPIATIAAGMTARVDMIVTGHTHQPYVCQIPDPRGRDRLVTSASSYGRVLTDTTLYLNPRTKDVNRSKSTSQNILVTRDVADPEQTSIINKWKELADPVANRVVGTIAEDILKSENRDTESSLANLIADAQLAATSSAPANAQIALMNPGGVRADLLLDGIAGGEAPGEITYGEAFTVQPFGNLLVTVTMTGKQVEEVLEQQYISERSRPELILGISQGLTFDYVTNGPEGDRVRNIQLNGAALDPAANYQVTINNFLADGGDSFTAFTSGTNRIGGGEDLDAFTDYLAANSPAVGAPTDRINEITE